MKKQTKEKKEIFDFKFQTGYRKGYLAGKQNSDTAIDNLLERDWQQLCDADNLDEIKSMLKDFLK